MVRAVGLSVFVLAACFSSPAFANGETPTERQALLDSLVATEHAFSRDVRFAGMRDAFLNYAAHDGLLFRPEPVSARKWIEEQPTSGGILGWEPLWADVSRAGDLGWTTGPYDFRMNTTERPFDFGNYVSIWRREGDGSWRFVLYAGTGNKAPTTPPGPLRVASEPEPLAAALAGESVEKAGESLLAIDRALSDSSLARGARAAFANWMSGETHLLRRLSQPRYGSSAVGAFPGPRDTLTWQPQRAHVAQSRDLGYTYGTYRVRPGGASAFRPEEGSYVRIWRRHPDGRWFVVLDLALPKSA